MLEMKDFEKMDHLEYPCAVDFEDGTPSAIARYVEDIVLLVTPDILEIIVFGKHYALDISDNKYYKIDICNRVLREFIVGFTPKEIGESLESIGFFLAYEDDEYLENRIL